VNSPAEAVSLGEGLTPFLQCLERGPFQGFGDLWVKDEGFNPTQSFKARGMSAAITRAAALGVRAVAAAVSGKCGWSSHSVCCRGPGCSV
jgi:threonine synthase